MMFVDEDQQQTLTGVTHEPTAVCDSSSLHQLLEPLVRQQCDTADKLATLTSHINQLERQIRASYFGPRWQHISERDIAILLIAVFIQLLFIWLFK